MRLLNTSNNWWRQVNQHLHLLRTTQLGILPRTVLYNELTLPSNNLVWRQINPEQLGIDE